jgi:hypothetical protein
MLDESVVRRLAFIEYFYKVAVEQSQKPEPLCSTSILTFHDAIEFFLQLASEYLDVGREQPSFMEYWDILASKLPEGMPTQKESIRKLNRARVELKHHGILPSKLDIETFRASAKNFFEENTPPIFNINFSEISLIYLVLCEETKKSLKESEQLLQENKIEESLDKVALAFTQLIDDYESRKIGHFGRSPFFFGESLTFLSSFNMGIDKSQVGELADFIDKIKESVEAIQNAIKILSLGVDYRRYVKFRLLTPHIYQTLDGNYHVSRIQWGEKGVPSVEDVQFCIEFVIESAVILQEFDFNIEGR